MSFALVAKVLLESHDEVYRESSMVTAILDRVQITSVLPIQLQDKGSKKMYTVPHYTLVIHIGPNRQTLLMLAVWLISGDRLGTWSKGFGSLRQWDRNVTPFTSMCAKLAFVPVLQIADIILTWSHAGVTVNKESTDH